MNQQLIIGLGMMVAGMVLLVAAATWPRQPRHRGVRRR